MSDVQSVLSSSCLLCESQPEPELGFHLKGIKIIEGKEIHYHLCRSCCMKTDEQDYTELTPSRRKVWQQVEKKLQSLV